MRAPTVCPPRAAGIAGERSYASDCVIGAERMSVKTGLVNSPDSTGIPHHNIFKTRKCQF